MNKKEQYTEIINSQEWRLIRRRKLNKSPTCERCSEQGFVKVATEVHHILPIESGLNTMEMRRLAFTFSNLMSVCHQCHVDLHDAMGRTGRAAAKRLAKEHLERFNKKFS